MNIFYPPNQDRVFIVMFFLGLLLGVLYDMFKIKRHIITTKGFLLIIDDILFSTLSIVLFLLAVFIVNNGAFRWFEPFSCLVGFYVYRATVSRPVLKCAYALSDLLIYIVKTSVRLILSPILLLIRVLDKHIFKPSKIIVFRKRQLHRISSKLYKFT